MEDEVLSDSSGHMEESDDDYEEPQPSTSRDSVSHKVPSNDDLLKPEKKRKRKEGRKRIRKILSQEQLDSETQSAQKEEQERLRRLELQKSLNHIPLVRTTPPSDTSSPSPSLSKVSTQTLLVDIPDKIPDKVIIIDDDSDDDCDIMVTTSPAADCVVISDSESSQDSNEEDNEAGEGPENSGSHTNDDVNQPDAHGRVLVNVNHPPSEPDIFLVSHLCSVVKPHQIGGIRFLYDNLVESLSRYQVSPGFGCILAHSMGLGKTLQVICFIDVFLRFTKARKVLCIVPMNTIQNWYSEFNTWLPVASGSEGKDKRTDEESNNGGEEKKGRTFQVLLFSENVKTTVARSALIGKWEKRGGVLLMGYEMYRILAMYTQSLVNNTKLTGSKRRKNTNTTEVIDLDEEEKNMDLLLEIQKSLCKPGPDLVVCDEGHRIKNSQANISQALKKLQTRRRVVLTGYPLQNNLMEYWCMVDFVRPNFLGTKHEFSNMFERPIVNGQCVDSTASDIKLMRFRAHVLHSLLEGFVQRRSESVLTKTLPEKEEYVIPVKMAPIQISLYQAFVSSVRNYVGYINPIKAFGICIKIWNHPDILKNYLDSKKDTNRNDSPLTVCDPDLDIGVTMNKKTKDARNDARLFPGANSEATLAPADMRAVTNGTDWVGDLMDTYQAGVLQHGAKMVLLMEIIEKSVQMGDKILVFSQSLSTLSIIEDFLRKRVVPPQPSQLMFQPVHWERNKNYYRLDGGTSSQEREKLITAFNSKTNHSVFVFLLSTRACSLGVNLIGANRVVIFDASWNPCHDAQAVCRIYRYGQSKKCFIYRLVSHGTFEKRMYERQVTKEGMSDRVIDELNPEANLTKQEVMHLFKEATNDSEEHDLDIPQDSFPDAVLNHVCSTCRKSMFEIPFKHKLQSSHKPRNILTKAEKREAKKGYEREKRAINSANKSYSSSTNCSALVREQIRKEIIDRPVGHVKPIQNVQANSGTVLRPQVSALPAPIQPPVNPFRSSLPSMALMAGLSFPPLLNNRLYQPGELRPLTPYPVNFRMPFPFPGMSSTLQPSQTAGAPVVVDLLASPDEKADYGNASRLGVAETVGDLHDVQGSGKPGVVRPQTLCEESSCCVNQNTVGASEQSGVFASGNPHEISTSISESEILEPEILKRNLIETVKDSTMTKTISKSISTLSSAHFGTQNPSSSINTTEPSINHQAALLPGHNEASSSSKDKNSEIFGHIASDLSTTESNEISLPVGGKECTVEECDSMEMDSIQAEASNV